MKQIILVGILALFLVSCSGTPHDNGMKAQLDAIRVMIKQSALMATNAACADIKERDMLIHAAAAQARRAMGGSEMFKIHKMMNMEPDSTHIERVLSIRNLIYICHIFPKKP